MPSPPLTFLVRAPMTTTSLEGPEVTVSAPTPPTAEARATRRYVLRGGAVALVGGVVTFLLAADDARLRFGVPLGALATIACAVGLMDMLGSFEVTSADEAFVAARDLARPLARVALSACVAVLSLWAAVHAVLPEIVAGAILAASSVGLIASVFAAGVVLGPLRLDEDGRDRPLLRRHGFWLLAAMALLYFPALGIGSLTDPWETHYGEVAREVLARDDWISLWWSWQGFFFSKPVLGIWLQSLMMGTLGVHVEPDAMLTGVAGRLAHPEWAVRFPFALFAIGGVYLLYKGASRWLGRRAAFLGALALATAPQWFLVAHQSMTDMPYVAALTGAMGLVMLAAREDDVTLAKGWNVRLGERTIRLDAWHLVMGAVLVTVLPQILYLLSRNVELVLHGSGPHGFRLHLDEVFVGSGLGNCGQPGDPACGSHGPAMHLEPWLQALGWSALLASFVALCARERRVKRLLYLGAWFLAALSTMEKGPAGVAIPGACVFAWLCVSKRWVEFTRAELAAGLLMVVLVVMPWFVAFFVRNGTEFTDELIFHDMFNRTFEHVHDTNGGADTSLAYYVGQLGYALFPWTALAPVGLFVWQRRGTTERDAITLLVLWFLVSFALFSAMGTKFHHYILPAVPPAAMLAGIGLDALLGAREERDRHARVMLAAASLAGALVLGLLARDFVVDAQTGATDGAARFMQLFTYRYDRGWPAALSMHTPFVLAASAGAAVLVALAVPRTRRYAAAGWLALALVWSVWGLDVYLPRASYFWGQRAVIGAYYTHRASASEPIVAYLMNWKGESFYTGNRIPQFGTPTVPAGTPAFSKWIEEERRKGLEVAYFVTERHSIGGLRNEIKPKEMHEVTSRDDCEQFVLLRAQL
jgi:4-amino-4-deoxy-L-arabinose transferase-like glycosyltransferase